MARLLDNQVMLNILTVSSILNNTLVEATNKS